jgi:hypothetical protein
VTGSAGILPFERVLLPPALIKVNAQKQPIKNAVTSGATCGTASLKSAAVLLAAWPWSLRREY